MIYETQEQLDAGLAKWQKILRLQDWTVRAVMIDHPDGKIDNSTWGGEAMSATHVATKRITIRILRKPLLYPEWEIDHEPTLVHELLHGPFESFAPEEGTMEHKLWEQTIDVLAQQFVMLDRQKASKPYRFVEEVCPRCCQTLDGKSIPEILRAVE